MLHEIIKNLPLTGVNGESPLGIRLSNEFRELIRERAKANGRSINAEILFRLRESMLEECKNEMSENKKTQCTNTGL